MSSPLRRDVVIGSQEGLKHPWSFDRTGSTPVLGTQVNANIQR